MSSPVRRWPRALHEHALGAFVLGGASSSPIISPRVPLRPRLRAVSVRAHASRPPRFRWPHPSARCSTHSCAPAPLRCFAPASCVAVGLFAVAGARMLSSSTPTAFALPP
ncbi:hypothetical protein VPH35_064414 [Triticum aestivum]